MSNDVSQFMKELESIMGSPPLSELPASSASLPSAQAPEAGRKIKLLVVSTHVNQVNGYSKVFYHLFQQLAALPWLDLVHFGTQRMVNADLGRKYPSTVKVIDGSALEKDKQATGFAFAELPVVIQAEKPDVVFLYNDLAILCAYIEGIRKVIEQRSFRIWAYVDMCYPSPPPQMMDVVNRDVERIFCFTKSWKDVLKSHGATRPMDVLPHAVDPTVYRSIPKEIARQTLGLPKDVFLFTSLNKNIPRKRLDVLILSFVKLMVRFPTKPLFLLIVADKGDRGGYPLFDIFAREIKLQAASVEMFGNRLLITSKDTCYRDEDINLLYNCGDVGVSCAEGEGFGLCTFEQMSLGIPQIVPDIHGYSEYCVEDNSLRVKPKMRVYLPQAHQTVTGEANLVDPEDVSKAMERYVFDDDLRALHGEKGKEKTLTYTWEKSAAVLVKRLKALQEDDD